MSSSPRIHRVRSALVAAAMVAAGGVGSLATLPNIPTWYAALHKPVFTPPNAVFGPVWTLLYVLMAMAFWRVLTLPSAPGKRVAVIAFTIQIVLNGLWSVAFFGLHAPFAGLVVIALLDVAVVATVVTFARLDRTAALLLAPYGVWIGFATALNTGILLLNR